MAQPQEKDSGIETFMASITGKNRRSYINANVCILCDKPATEFTNELSAREFTISGMCQNCQNAFFD